MVTLSVEGDRLHLEVQAWDQLWALRSHLEIPLAQVVSVRADPEPARSVIQPPSEAAMLEAFSKLEIP